MRIHTRSHKMHNTSHNESSNGTGASNGADIFTVKLRTLRVRLNNINAQIESNDDFLHLQTLLISRNNVQRSIDAQYAARLEYLK